LHCNGSRGKLDAGGMRKHRGDRKRDREVKERSRRKVR